jgi:ribulose-phosphate 3-epimerase
MKPQFIPAILTDSADELVRLVHILERAGVERAHLDICDGIFVPTRTISGYDELRRICATLKWDVHLMIKDPEHFVDHWHSVQCADRFIVHVEATRMMDELIEHCHGHAHELWAAINPTTPLEQLTGQKTLPDGALFMTVEPGAQGRAFVPEVLSRIRAFHEHSPAMPIMVDGGITPATAHHCAAAGANVLVSGSYIIKSPDPVRALRELEASLAQATG